LRNTTLRGLASFLVALMLAIFGFIPASLSPNLLRRAPAAARRARKSPYPEIPYTKFVLDNGLTVLVHEDHKAEPDRLGWL